MTTLAKAHPNIALIKYWGKQHTAGNIPATPSLSITLDTLTSTTRLNTAAQDSFTLNGSLVDDPKIAACLAILREQYEIPPLVVVSDNNFPTAAGLASSASGFAALITAINHHCSLEMSQAQQSAFAREASGSAARSIFGGYVGLSQPDWVAKPLLDAELWPLRVVIAITDERPKSVSSTVGMQRSQESSPFYPTWVADSEADYLQAETAVAQQDFAALAQLAQASCLKMHAVMQSSQPPLIYWNPATLACLERIREMQDTGLEVFFTIAAGPQVKAVCTAEFEAEVTQALANVAGVRRTLTVGLGTGATIDDT
ncbi:MAG: diphosphomevalonate decarboxylase [Gammaproteobacteria bacterium]|nr:diphosphomevalonate decarboxylase [Gammaproteobacteria bacterium]